jgi:hypothetical protein
MSDELREHNTGRREREEATKDSDDEPPRNKKCRRNFDDYFQDLVAYKQKHGDCTLLHSEDPRLHNWVKYVRRGRGAFGSPMINETDWTEWTWATQKEKKRIVCEKLKVYKQQHGNCSVPGRYEKGKSLGTWVSGQRARLAKDTTPQYQKDLLNKLGFDWKPAHGGDRRAALVASGEMD